jgi:hypothetical protein
MYGLSGRQWMASISSSRRAVSRASAVPAARLSGAWPFSCFAADFTAGRDLKVAFFFVAMLLFPPRRLRQNDGRCLAFIHKTGKSECNLKRAAAMHFSVSFDKGLIV